MQDRPTPKDWTEHLVVSPAYGREYANTTELLKDWNQNLDFVIESTNCPWVGRNISQHDCLESGVKAVKLRYARGQKELVVVPSREALEAAFGDDGAGDTPSNVSPGSVESAPKNRLSTTELEPHELLEIDDASEWPVVTSSDHQRSMFRNLSISDAHVNAEFRTVAELRRILATLPDDMEVMVTLDGRRFSLPGGLGLFVGPLTDPDELQMALLAPRGTVDGWSGRAEMVELERMGEEPASIQIGPCGADYLHDVEAQAAWRRGDSFEVLDAFHNLHGQRLTRDGFAGLGISRVRLYYAGGARFCILRTSIL